MLCLALECSTAQRSVAIARDGIVLAQVTHAAGRETPLFAMIEEVLHRAGITPASIECLAVGLGPGSYTGIRIAIAAAQGWELAHGQRLVGIDSVQTTAFRARELGFRGPTAVIADAHRGEVYLAEYDLSHTTTTLLSPLRIAHASEVDAARARGLRVIGPDLASLGIEGDPVYPDAATVAQLATQRPGTVAPEPLQPIYLRATTFVKAPPARTP